MDSYFLDGLFDFFAGYEADFVKKPHADAGVRGAPGDGDAYVVFLSVSGKDYLVYKAVT